MYIAHMNGWKGLLDLGNQKQWSLGAMGEEFNIFLIPKVMNMHIVH